MSDEIKMTIRLSPELHERLGRAAGREHRSKHAQMISYIERGLDQDDKRARRQAVASSRTKGEDADGT